MIKIRKFKKDDTYQTAFLIAQTYKKYCSNEGSKKAIQNYIDRVDPNKNELSDLEKNFLNSDLIYLATHKNEIIGMIRGRKNRITNLFVNGKYHKQGIGGKLVKKFETKIKKSDNHEIKIRASIYAAPFYKKMGYKKTTGERTFHGLKIQPMKKII
jgi:hypothetical protein